MSQSCQAEHFIYTFVFYTLLVASAKPTLIMIITELRQTADFFNKIGPQQLEDEAGQEEEEEED